MFTSSWKDVRPRGYYVYIHRRAADGTVFYVGKGTGRRAWDYKQRSKWWGGIANKNGVSIDIIKDGMSEACAFSLERVAIYSIRKSGVNLCNMSDGGDGSRGVDSVNRKKVYCSNGMSFESTVVAASWVSDNISPDAHFSAISAAALGNHYSAYGLCWSYSDDVPEFKHPSQRRRDHFSVAIVSSCGMEFTSLTEGEKWLRANGYPSASSSKISLCLNGKRNKAYGRSWSRK